MTITPAATDAPPQDSTQLERVFLILTFGAAAMAALLALLPAAGHDQIWFLLMARRWLGGAQIYGPQIFDSNPPGIVWLSAIPVWLGNFLHVPGTTVGKLLTAISGFGSALLSYTFLRRAWREHARYEVLALLFAVVVLFSVVPARDFGQRDHIVAFLMLPYILVSAVPAGVPRLNPWRLAAGLSAGAGICLKPHHALVPLFLEASLLLSPPADFPVTLLARLRNLMRPEVVTLVAFVATFLLAVYRFTPLYFSLALPVLRDTYWAIGRLSVSDLLREAIELCLLGAVAFVLFFHLQRRSPAVHMLLVAGSAATVAYMLQGTGWYYQQLPAICFFGAALALLLLDWLRGQSATPSRRLAPAVAGLCVLAVVLTTHFTGYPFTQERSFGIESPDPEFFRRLPPSTPVATLTTSVDEAIMPIERYGLTWAQRTNNLWLLPAVLRNEVPSGSAPARKLMPDQVARLDAMEHRWMVEDLQRWRPQMVLVERCQDGGVQCQVLEDRHDDLLAWFLRDAAFRNVWGQYRYVETRGRFDAYVLRP